MRAQVVFVIPAYQPNSALIEFVQDLRRRSPSPIIVVNDGSSESCDEIFQAVQAVGNVQVLRHAVNLGKGAALKTAFNHAIVEYGRLLVGVVTADADGQHLAEDTLRVHDALARNPSSLVLGVRQFDMKQDVPLRSRFGNQLTKGVFRVLTGVSLADTQTGLRGIPAELLPSLLCYKSDGYEFETEMLITASHEGKPIVQIPIQTVYLENNASSHFNPLLDSLRIYFVFLRFAMSSAITALIDLVVFMIAQVLGGQLLLSSLAGRVVAGTFNFISVKRLVFRSKNSVVVEAIRYTFLVLVLMLISNAGIETLVENFGANVYFSKILVESTLFLLSFSVQRIFIFSNSKERAEMEATDWNAYYQKPFKAASLTRKITTSTILRYMRKYGADLRAPRMIEFGGGNSCIYGLLDKNLNPSRYVIVDDNRLGLEKFKETYPEARNVELIQDDVMNLEKLKAQGHKADICFSIGLIEHFSVEGTKKAIKAHFESIKPNGLVLITFPTPTWLYRVVRGMAEFLGIWAFPDERPCRVEEISSEVAKYAEVHHQSILWPIFLTQGIIVARPRISG